MIIWVSARVENLKIFTTRPLQGGWDWCVNHSIITERMSD